jgi:1-acyl-sn-glycerol-3-phosphate acyltransferase
LAGNHPSYLDPLIIIGLLAHRRSIRFMAWSALWRSPALRWFLDRYGAFPVDLERSGRDSFQQASGLLAAGEVVALFPEGGRSLQRAFMPRKRGAVRLALRSQAPLVPFAILGTRAAWPLGASLPRPARVRLVLAPPLQSNTETSPSKREQRLFQELHTQVNSILLAHGEITALPQLPGTPLQRSTP